MAFSSRGYDPESIAFLDECLEKACQAAGEAAAGDGMADLRHKLASAILEGFDAGMRDRSSLVDFALRVLPNYRDKVPG